MRVVSEELEPQRPAGYHASGFDGHDDLKCEVTQPLLNRYMVRQGPHHDRHADAYKHELMQRIYKIRQNQQARRQLSLTATDKARAMARLARAPEPQMMPLDCQSRLQSR